MIELFEPADEHDPRLALGATGLLREFNEAGVLTAADVHVARRVGRLAGEDDERVLLAAALAVRAVRHGSVSLDLATVADVDSGLPWPSIEEWVPAVTASPLVVRQVLRQEFGLLYLDRYWQQEVQLCADLTHRLAQPPPTVDAAALDAGGARVFGGDTYAEQRAASRRAVAQWTTVLTGGPGTGKTTTVAGILALLTEQAGLHGTPLRMALAAPTGKAAARLHEAVAAAARNLPAADRGRLEALPSFARPATTLHRLLGWRRDNSTRFRHHRGNRLPHDVVVVDEASMVSLTHMTRLVEALRPDARLLLVGDPDQLASVEAGAVLADLVAGYADRSDDPVVRLETAHRFGDDIATLASAVRQGSADQVLEVLRSGRAGIELVEDDDPAAALEAELTEAAVRLRELAAAGDTAGALAALDERRLLCAHREGPYGVHHWNRQVAHWLSEATGDPLYAPMYAGRPLLVTANDVGLGVSNGDTGVVVREGEGLRAVVGTAGGERSYATSRFSDVETMYAMTIHKSQGGQADRVTVLLPPEESPLISRELLYTALTRARKSVRVVGTEAAVRAAVARRAVRASGLVRRLR